MEQSKVDPCLFMLRRSDGSIAGLLVNYVDDGIIVGTPEAVRAIKAKVKATFTITELGPLKKHLGVHYKMKNDRSGNYLEVQMQAFRDDLIKDYEEAVGKLAKVCNTPGAPGKVLIKNEEDVMMETEYRKLVGKLLWTVKKESPDCANAVRELSAHLSSPGKLHWDAIGRIVGFLAGNRKRVLKMRIPTRLQIVGYGDSNWAASRETQKSTTGFLITIGGCLVSWLSKAQPSVTLSSTEAEYVALSMCAQEIKFIKMLLDEIVPGKAEMPSILREDNTGAIFTAQNQQIGTRTKHIDVKYHHVKDMLEDGELVLKFVRSEENFADLMTKNVRDNIHATLSVPLMDGTMDTVFGTSDEEDVKNSVPSGFDAESNLGLNLVLTEKEAPQGEWTEVVRRKSKIHVSETGTKRSETRTQRSETGTYKCKTGPDSANKTVTWLDRARSKGGQSWKDVCNSKKSQVSSWKRTAYLGKGKHG